MKIRFLNGRFQGRTYDLKKGLFTIGRGADNDLVLDDDGISRAHCRIVGDGTQFVLEDQGSTNGVRINGKRIEGRVTLKPSDNIGIGQHILLAADENDLANPAALPVTDPAPVGAAPPKAAPAAAAAPGTRSQLSAAPAPVPTKPFPFIRAVVLIILVALLGVVVYLTFFAPMGNPPGAAAAGTPGTDEKPAQPHGDSAALMPPASSASASAGSSSASGSDSGATATPKEPADNNSASSSSGSSSASGTGSGSASGSSAGSAGSGSSAGGERPAGGSATAAAAAATEPATGGGNVAVVESEPSGAEVKLNGASVGKTPMIIRNLAVGRQTLTLHLKGYEDFTRQIHVPDALPEKPFALKQKPGTLLLTSVPSGASILQGSRILGQTPLLVDDLAPGDYELYVSLMGYEPKKIKATIAAIRQDRISVELKSRLGTFEIVTLPAGCAVYVDETFFGKTSPGADPLAESKPLSVTNLLSGEHTVRAKHLCGVDTRLRLTLAAGETEPVPLRLWIVDTEVVLKDGSKKQGMLTEKNAAGDIVLRESAKKSERIFKPDILKIVPLTLEQTRQVMEKVRPLDVKEKEPSGGTLPPAEGGGGAGVKSGGAEPATVSGLVGGDEEEAPKAKPAEKKTTTKVQGMVGDE